MAPPTHKNQSKSYITRGRKGTKGLKEHSIPSSSILDLKHGGARISENQVNSEKPATAQFIHKSQLLNK